MTLRVEKVPVSLEIWLEDLLLRNPKMLDNWGTGGAFRRIYTRRQIRRTPRPTTFITD